MLEAYFKLFLSVMYKIFEKYFIFNISFSFILVLGKCERVCMVG